MMGLPIWFTLGILVKFSPKIGLANAVAGKVSVADAVMFAYIGLSFGDLVCGWLSQVFKSRRKVIIGYLSATVLVVGIYLFSTNVSLQFFYSMCFLIGVGSGYWGLFATIASEQFGTNLRATVAITVPNFVRGAVIPITLAFKSLEVTNGAIYSCLVVGGVCFVLAFVSIFKTHKRKGA